MKISQFTVYADPPSKTSPLPFLNEVIAKVTFLLSLPILLYMLLYYVNQEAVLQEAQKKQHCARGGNNKWRQTIYGLLMDFIPVTRPEIYLH